MRERIQGHPTKLTDIHALTASEAHLMLRDIFNPLCLTLAQKIRSIPMGEFQNELTHILSQQPKRIRTRFDYVPDSPFATIPAEELPRYPERIVLDSHMSLLPKTGSPEFALAMVKAANTMAYFLFRDSRTSTINEINKLVDNHYMLFEHSLFFHTKLVITLRDGLETINSSISFFMNSDVGEPNPVKLARAIVDQGLLERLSVRAPLNLLGPLAVASYHFPFPLMYKTAEGKLELTRQAIETLQKEKDAMDKTIEGYRPVDLRAKRMLQTNKGCPAGRKSTDTQTNQTYSGIGQLASVFMDYVEYFYSAPLDPEVKASLYTVRDVETYERV